MQCPKCGATLKETAIFCNRCGRRLVSRPQHVTSMRLRMAAQSESPDAASAAQEPTTAAPADAGVVKQSVRRGNALPTPLSLPIVDTQSTQPVPPVPPALSADELDLVSAAETLEWPIDAPLPSAPVAAPAAPPPLPVGAVIAARYRVARFLGQEGGSNLYQVRDQHAEDHCWACQAPWSAANNERFCEQCGAERRDSTLGLRERSGDAGDTRGNSAVMFVDGERVYTIVPVSDLPPVPPEVAPLENLPTAAIPVATSPPAPQVEMPARDPLDEAATAEVPIAGIADASPLFFTPESLGLTPQEDVSVAAPVDEFQQNNSPTIETQILNTETWQPRARVVPTVRVGIASDVGRSRRGRANEDTAIALTLAHVGEAPPAPLTLCVVADGLGGHDDGQRAGRMAARIVAAHVLQHLWLPALHGLATPDHDAAGLGEVLQSAIQAANTQILATNIAENCDMGCTITALVAQGGAACIANVGDSRTYRFDGQTLRRVTTDHSLVARLVAAGMLAPDDVYSHPQRSQIYRSLGDETEIQVDLFPLRLEPGDTFVLCSDGLWEMVRDPEITRILANTGESAPQNIAEQLINVANDNGGEDNVTVVIAQVVA